ncbi:MAG: RNA polymerase factor sigma-54 [Deltaproteobacteria bacterium]|nr:RNA polymerase factor sigma-54 [Deltaproteobacteria bacterium]
MVMELKQQLKMVQQLVMTPQLQQAIKLLQMSRLELVESVYQELMENPVLEDQSETVQDSEASAQSADWSNGGNGPTIEQANERDDKAIAEALRGSDKKNSDIDWERYLENHTLQGPVAFGSNRSQDELPNYEMTLTKAGNLSDHLMWQARMSDFVEDELGFTELVVGNLDERGFLTLEGMSPEEVVPKLAQEAEVHPEDAEEVLKIIQRFDPVGVASRTLQECLLVQAKHFDLDQLVCDVLIHHLHDLERKDYQTIAKALSVSLEEVYDVAQVIAELEPRPARNYVTEEPHYIIPDVYVHKVGDKYFVVANDDGMPKLKISRYYRSAMLDDKKAKEYIQNKLRSAQWLIRSIEQRRKTIERVTECIVEKQYDFFEKGIEYLKPMILRDVADEVQMHESTISRVTSNKYVHTPRGLFELKFFFNSGIRRSESEDIASESVKQTIKKIIESEDQSKPYSDQKIVELLADHGVVIARRTVTKYREMLRILSSSKRKKYF